MKRSLIVLFAAGVALVGYACVPPPPAPIVGSPTTPCRIEAKIAQLTPGFDPPNYGNCVQNLPCSYPDPTHFVTSHPTGNFTQEVKAIAAAFSASTPRFQAALCGLNAIYLNTDQNPNSPLAWGMRERLYPQAGGGFREHIAISSARLDAVMTSPTPFADNEKFVLIGLMQPSLYPPSPITQLPPGSVNWENAVSYTAAPDPASSDPSTRSEIAIMGILAHEMGHIVWFDKVIPDGQLITNQATPSGDPFSKISWKVQSHIRGFHGFGQANNNADPRRPPVAPDLKRDLRNGCTSCASSDLSKIYGGEWASLFASVAPDEDFVETYKLLVLADKFGGPLHSLSITIPNIVQSPDILGNLYNPGTTLYQKATLIQSMGLP